MQKEEFDFTHEVFRQLIAAPGRPLAALRAELLLSEAELAAALAGLTQCGLVHRHAVTGEPLPVTPEAALARLFEQEQQYNAERMARLQQLQTTLAAIDARLTSAPGLAEPALGSGSELIVGEAEIGASLESATARARKEILSMHPGRPRSPAQLADGMRRNHELLDRGVGMRTLQLDAMLRVPHGRAHLRALEESGAEVRIAPVLPFRLIVVDGIQAYAAAPSPDDRQAAVLMTDPRVVEVLCRVFEHFWVHGAKLPDNEPPAPADDPLTERERALLRMLFQGMKDDAVSRSLGVSPRTLRRLLTDVMAKLDADSRFQAGARAMARGWLTEE
ncbi:LuxR C-terminal-related transcriptional regulator [Streptomyces sp. NPDC086023]|uniref:helix-turn-helix transcriptional regulator n=1 Tax=Streptomyces sp. NPDC086023 TaxID=3365746 RepID=UPI0037CD72D2